MFVLYFSSLYVLVVALFTLSSTCEVSLCLYAGGPLHFIASPPSQATSHCCWETIIGQELYKLTIINLLTDLGFVILLDGARWILSTRLFLPCTNLNKLYNEWVRILKLNSLCILMFVFRLDVVSSKWLATC